MSNANKRVLITGRSGFTGRYMEKEMLSAGYQVYGLALDGEKKDIDIVDEKKVNHVISNIQPHIIIHLAAIAYVGHTDTKAIYDVNIMGARNLLSALSKNQTTPDAILLASSANIYGNTTEGVLKESSTPNPQNDYAVSKLAMEFMANLWRDKLPIIITRPFNYSGVGQSNQFLLPKIISHFHSKQNTIELGNLNVSRDFCDVRAVVHAYRLLVEKINIKTTVNICTGKAYSLLEIIEICSKITGHDIDVKVNQNYIRENEVKFLCGDSGHLRNLIGTWSPPTLNDTIQWMLESS